MAFFFLRGILFNVNFGKFFSDTYPNVFVFKLKKKGLLWRPFSKISGYGYQIRRIRVEDTVFVKKNLRIRKHPDTFVRGLMVIIKNKWQFSTIDHALIPATNVWNVRKFCFDNKFCCTFNMTKYTL